MLGVEALLPRIQPGDLGLQGGEVALGPLGSRQRLLASSGQAPDLVIGGSGARLSALT